MNPFPRPRPSALAFLLAGCASAAPPSPEAAELGRIGRQLEEFYGPMLFLVEESRLAIEDVLVHLGRDYVFPVDGPLPPGELRYWLFRAENDLMPRNDEMAALARERRDLVDGPKLPAILDALVEHQAAWRELHRRWKEKGEAYPWRSPTPFPRNLGTVLAREFERLKKRQGELLPRVPGAELRHVERQIEGLYAPLVRLSRELDRAFSRAAAELGRNEIFPLGKEEIPFWTRRCEDVLFPLLEEIRGTIRRNFFLVEGTAMPEGFLAFLDYWNSWKMDHARWKEQAVPYPMRSRLDYPREEFAGAAERTLRDLESRRARLARPPASP